MSPSPFSELMPKGPLQNLIQRLKGLPGIGEKTATRLAYFILRQPTAFAEQLAAGVVEAKHRLNMCHQCQTFTENTVCEICLDGTRLKTVLCVVEEPSDITAMERSGAFRGLYHVLHGVISPLEGLQESHLRVQELCDRIEREGIQEVILATNPTVEGDTTALYIAGRMPYNKIKITRLAHGIPVGAEIEYTDSATLGKAIQNRTSL